MHLLLNALAQTTTVTDETNQKPESTAGTDTWKPITGGFTSETGVEVATGLGSIGESTAASILFSLLEGIDSSAFVIDADGIFRYANSECRELFDREEGELLGENLFEYENADNEIVRERVLGEGKAIQRDEEIELDDGSVRYSERSVYPLFDEAGAVTGAIEINRDVTERVLSQQREAAIRAYQATAIADLKRAIRRLGDGDFTVKPTVPEPEEEFREVQEVAEEFKRMARDLRNAVDSTNQALLKASRTAEELNRLSDHLQRGGDEAVGAVTEIEAANERVASVTTEQDRRIDEAVQNVSSLSAATEEITASTQKIQAQAQNATDLAEDGTDAAQRSIGQMEAATDASRRNIEQVESLEEQTAQIEAMIDMIEDIADQTNLLALNANIQAARAAGSESKGFAVVANEIKQLAAESKETVNEISTVLETLTELIEDTARSIDRSNDQIQDASAVVDNVVDTIDEINTAIERTKTGVAEISTATDNQATNTEEVLEIVELVSEGSETVEARMADVGSSVETQAEIIDRVTDAADTIDDLGDDLERQLSAFDIADTRRSSTGTHTSER